MNSVIRNAAVAAVVGVGMVAGCVPPIGAEASTIPDGTGSHLRLKWTHQWPEMEGNTEITVRVVGAAEVNRMWIESGGDIPRGGIVMGLSKIFEYTFKVAGRPDYKCDVYLSFHPNLDPDTLEHELRHCAGWNHDAWNESNLGAE